MKPLLGDAWWILRNDLRLLWAGLLASRWRNAVRATLVLAGFGALNAVSMLVFGLTHYQPGVQAQGLAWLFFATVMLGSAVNHAIAVLFERADFDLLLSAPISPRSVVLARVATLVAGALISTAFFVLPLVNGAIVGASGVYAFAYLVWLALAAITASIALWIAVLAVRTVGARPARIGLQITGALVGGAVYLATQAHALLTADQQKVVASVVDALVRHPPVSGLVEAGQGQIGALSLLLGSAAVLLALTAHFLGRLFVRGVQESTIPAAAPRREMGNYEFTDGAAYVTFRKDLRLIARDPLLLGKLLPSVMYWVPLVFVFARMNLAAGLAIFALMLATQFSTDLCEVAVAGEECGDLIAMSPTAELQLRLAKLAAGAALPLAAAAALCVTIAALGRPWLAVTALAFTLLSASAAAWMEVTDVQPSPRHDLIRKQRTSWRSRRIVGLLLMLTGSVGLGAAGTGHLALGSVFLGLVALGAIACFTLVEPKPLSATAHA